MSESGSRPLVGVDLDGVLANQIDGVLPIVKERFGVTLTYEDITHWRLPIESELGSSDIATEIVAAQSTREYVLSMPVHVDAEEMLGALGNAFRVVVLTARSGEALSWSEEWLRLNGLPFDELVGSTEAKKSLHGVDALVDDYLGNVEEFLSNSSGPAVLVDQPWNRAERDVLEPYLERTRVAVVSRLRDVPQTMADLLRAAT
jgi:uncharacterized HAD superfamily protein